ncbi:MAG: RiPP maturation radical SAM C-methyltransferase, partial [Terriglobales bacterium]
GEGERVLVEVVRDILASSTIRPQPGLCYRPNGASVVIPMETRPQLSIDEVPQPTYDEYFSRLERSALRAELLPEVAILFESSRGCWWGAKQHCTFCGLNNATMAFRSKPAARVADEILDLAERYKVLSFVAVDDIIDLTHIRDLLPMLSYAGCDLSIFYETKANLKKEQLRAMYSAGVTAIQPGIESLSTPILQLMRKGVTALQNIRLLKWCAEFGIVPAWNLLYGFPGEPQEEYERMCDLVPSLVHLEAPNISPIQLQRFSPYFERAAEFGLKIMGPLQQYKHLYQISSEALWNLAYDFDHSYSDGRDPQSYTENIVGAIQQWRESSSKAFGTLAYFRGPGFIIVQDRRPGLDPNDYRFDGPEAKIYLGCDAGATPEELEKQLAIDAEEDLSSDEIREFLEEVVNARLMYREGNRYLSLATAASGSSSRTLRIAS